MRRLVARLLAAGLLALAGAAAAQEPAAPADTPPAASPAPVHGPYVGDETHRAPLESDIPFPEGVTPRERPVAAPSYRRPGRARAHRSASAHRNRHAPRRSGGTRRHRHRR